MTEVSLLDQVKSALDALDSPQQCHAASAWLVEFEGRPEAWDIAQQLLLQPAATNKRFHGANIFYHKIKDDYTQLKENAALLKQTMVAHLIALAAESQVDVPVYRRICLCLAALALQMNEEGVVGDILNRLNAVVVSSPRLLLELLTVLPEECYNKHIIVAARIRHQFSDQLCRSAAQVFQFLHHLAGSCPPPSATETQRQILVCLEKWIDNSDIPLNAILLPSGIFSFALDALGQKNLLEEAAGVMIVVMQRYPFSPHSKDTALINSLLPRIMAVRAVWASEMSLSAGPNADVCRSVARLFTETMESYIELYLSPNDFGQHHILSQLLDCARFSDDFDVTRIPLRAFYKLAVSLKELSYEMSLSEFERFRESVEPFFLELLSIAVQQLRLDDSVLRGDDKLDSDELAERDEWRDTILDICDVAGSMACIERVCAVMQSELTKSGSGGAMSWGSIEACLFTIQIIGPLLPPNENIFLPQILQLFGTCPQVMGLHMTIMQVSGSVAHWINCNRKYLLPIFEQLLGALSVPALSLPASVALLKLCRRCGGREGVPPDQYLPLDKLLRALLTLRSAGTLSLEADTTLLEGLTYIITDMPPAEATEALKTIIQPTAESLLTHLSNGSPMTTAMSEVERITVLFRFTGLRRDMYSDTHPVTAVFLHVWPLLIKAMQTYNSASCYEKVCRCYKYVIKSSGYHFLPHLNAMAEHIVQQFCLHPVASFLYVAAVCFGEFTSVGGGTGGSGRPIGISSGTLSERCDETPLTAAAVDAAQLSLSNIFIYMSKIFFEKHQALDDFNRSPDVCEEYFFLSARVVQYLPDILLGAGADTVQRLQIIVQAALYGLRVPHRETIKGILTLFGEIMNLIIEKRDGLSESDKIIFSNASAVTSACASGLVQTVMGMVGDPGSSFIVEACLDNMVKLMWCLQEITPENMKVYF